MRGWGCIGVSLLASCSLIATRPLPSGYAVEPGVEPPCSQSNWAAGVDMITMVGTAIGAGVAMDEAANPTIASDGRSSGEDAIAGAVVLSGLALLTGYSMLQGFDRSSMCRSATAAAGLPTRGGSDWALPFVVLGAAAAAMSAGSGGGGTTSTDTDLCRPYQRRTALCRDGMYSCLLNRAGTCSHHQGVSALAVAPRPPHHFPTT